MTGSLEIADRDGQTIEAHASKLYLCRCGRSANKPFCDGSHARTGWKEDACDGPAQRKASGRGDLLTAHAPEELHGLVEAAFNARDIDRLVDLYDEDATLIVPPEGARVTGKPAIREAITATLALEPEARMEVLDKLVANGLALTKGRWTLTGTGEDGAPVELSGRGTMVSRCQPDGSWKIVLDSRMSFQRNA